MAKSAPAPARRGSLTVVGLGYVAGLQTSPEAKHRIEEAERLFFLVQDPVARRFVERLHPRPESLEDLYRDGRLRHETYAAMVERIVTPVHAGQRVCAAFYGHPGVFVRPSRLAIRRLRSEGYEARMVPAISAADCLYADLVVDPSEHGLQSYEATAFLLRRPRFDPTAGLVLWQVGIIGLADYRSERFVGRDGLRLLTEVLSRSYPPRHEVVIYEAAAYPVSRPRIDRLALEQLPSAEVDVRSTLFVPAYGRRPVDEEVRRRLGWPAARGTAGGERP